MDIQLLDYVIVSSEQYFSLEQQPTATTPVAHIRAGHPKILHCKLLLVFLDFYYYPVKGVKNYILKIILPHKCNRQNAIIMRKILLISTKQSNNNV